MAVELKYLGAWLIPLRSGYQPTWPLAIAPQPRHGASGAHSQPRRGASSVVASYALRTPEMVAWWEGFWSTDLALGAGRVIAMLDVAGYMAQLTAVISSARYTSYSRNMAVVELSLFIDSPAPVSTGYITSWIYPVSISDDVAGSAEALAGKEWPSVYEASVGGASILGGVMSEPIRYADIGADSAGGSASILSGVIRGTTVTYDLRPFDTERVTGGATPITGIIDTVVVPYDLRTFDTESTFGAATITGGTIA